MLSILAIVCSILMVLALLLIFAGMPGTWVIIVLAGLWAFFVDNSGFTWKLFALFISLAAIGEVVEFLAGYYGTKYFGGTNKGSIGGIVGAIIGAILCAPILFGIGALFGALGGGFLGCFALEKYHGMATDKALQSATGATLGRFGGFLVKLGIAVVLLWVILPVLWSAV